MKIIAWILGNFDKILLFILTAIIAFFFFATNLSCCGFKVQRFDGIPEECNVMYTTIKMASEQDDKSIVVNPSNWCKVALDRKRADCLRTVAGRDRLEKGNIEQHIQFQKCMNGELEK